jgi:integrase
MINITFKGDRLRKSTQRKIESKYFANGKIKKQHRNSFHYNRELTRIENELQEFILKNPKATIRDIENELPTILGNKKTGVYITDDIPEYLEMKSDTITKDSLKVYRYNLDYLKSYEHHTKKRITYNDIDEKFIGKFTNFLTSKKSMTSNAIKTTFTIIRTFLKHQLSKNIINAETLELFKIKKTEITQIALTETELNLIENIDLNLLSTKRKLHLDLFLIQCYTGLRVSDISKITKNKIQNGNMIIPTQKTKTTIEIPIIDRCRVILEKYKYNLPRFSINGYYQSLKKILQIAGIDTPTQMVKYYNNKRVETTLPKYELVGTHTGRRTFITLSLQKGILPQELMKITGHKEVATLYKYIQTDKTEAVNKIRDAWN